MGAVAPLTAGITYSAMAGGAGAAGGAGLMAGLGTALPVAGALALPIMYAVSPKFRKKYHNFFGGMKDGVMDRFSDLREGILDGDSPLSGPTNNGLLDYVLKNTSQQQRQQQQRRQQENNPFAPPSFDNQLHAASLMPVTGLNPVLPRPQVYMMQSPPTPPTFGGVGLAALKEKRLGNQMSYPTQPAPLY